MSKFKVEKPLSNANVAHTIRFTDALHNDLSELAAQKGISFNTLVLECCLYALENIEREENKDENKDGS